MSTLFNRKDTAVIDFALNNDLESFLNEYSTTTANPETLTKAYNEINSNKTKSTIAVNSGDGKADQPLAPIKKSEKYSLDKKGEIEVPKSLKFKKGELVAATPNPDAAITETKETKPAAKKTSTSKPKAEKKAAANGLPSKRDAIKAFLQIEGNATKPNKDIRAAIIAQGYPSCYDSEISAVKAKL